MSNVLTDALRSEAKMSGADANPYLSLIASLAIELCGIKSKRCLNIDGVKGSVYDNKSL